MSWTIEGDYIVARLSGPVQIVEELYQQGFNLVPRMFLGIDIDYGQQAEPGQLHIPKERFFHVAGGLREKVRSSPAYRAELHRLTWSLLHEFAVATRHFNGAVRSGTLTVEHLEQALQAHARVLALTEFNGLLPFAWYREQLAALDTPEGPLRVEDFAYSAVLPHIIQLRCGRLRLLQRYLTQENYLDDHAIVSFIYRLGCHDLPWLSPLFLDTATVIDQVRTSIVTLSTVTSVDDATAEVQQVQRNRKSAHERYKTCLGKVATTMLQRGADGAAVQNVIGALRVIALATTEEELRHIWQDHFWMGLGAVLRGLELPVTLVSIEELLRTFRHRPHFVPDRVRVSTEGCLARQAISSS